ncbi:hypothetical protein ACTU45_33240 [Streptomyces sp. 24-1644]|uniref:hypothetical protein n=1 Tax=Streptomyces sp. 24-1644 TaxID=3457315 RepID=UPI003FA78DC6
MLGDLASLLRAQRDGTAYRPQAAGAVVAAEDEELRAGQGASDGADERLGGVPSSDLAPAAIVGEIYAGQRLDDQAFDAGTRAGGLAAVKSGLLEVDLDGLGGRTGGLRIQ